MNEIIKTERLTKNFSDVTAVSEVNLNVGKGEIYGFLGLNGAGKTTTIRLLLGLITPSSGEAFINGRKVKPGAKGLFNDTGYLVEIPFSYPDLTVTENLEMIRRMRRITDKKEVQSIIETLKLTPYAHRKARNLSLGNSQRLGLAKALMHHPQVLILDAPTNGLDPAGIFEIREMLINLANNEGVTVFISSHILGEISRFATRIGIIHDGRLVQELNTHELEKLCRKRLLIDTRDNAKAMELLRRLEYPAQLNHSGSIELISDINIRKPEDINALLVGNDLPPHHLQVVEEDLESYFLRIIGNQGVQQ
jgi:ABC-2 type transport system ATP-binding protein